MGWGRGRRKVPGQLSSPNGVLEEAELPAAGRAPKPTLSMCCSQVTLPLAGAGGGRVGEGLGARGRRTAGPLTRPGKQHPPGCALSRARGIVLFFRSAPGTRGRDTGHTAPAARGLQWGRRYVGGAPSCAAGQGSGKKRGEREEEGGREGREDGGGSGRRGRVKESP